MKEGLDTIQRKPSRGTLYCRMNYSAAEKKNHNPDLGEERAVDQEEDQMVLINEMSFDTLQGNQTAGILYRPMN